MKMKNETLGARRPSPGANPGGGRPIGTKNRYGKDSVKKLEELGFDPVEKLVTLYGEWEAWIGENSSGSQVKEARKEQRFIASTLIPFRYQQVRVDDDDPDKVEPLRIEAIIKKEN